MLPTALDDTMLRDDVIELRLIRFMDVGDLSRRGPGTEFLAAAPEYRFAIHRRGDGLRVGRIHFRITNEPGIVEALGHMGYAVDEAHRGQGYAVRAIRLAAAVAGRLGQGELWVHVEPDNVPSRRAIERSGFELVEEVDSKAPALGLDLGPRLCRYRRATET
jgi:predicted acetyltransferase